MRRILYAIAALILFTAVACNKKDEDIDNVPDKGSIRFINVSDDQYNIYLDDFLYGNLYGHDSATFPEIVTGAHRVKAEQIGNVVGTPILRQQLLIVDKDTVVSFTFP